MRSIQIIAFITIDTAILLGSCGDFESGGTAEGQERSSTELWKMGGPTDRSKSTVC